MASVTLKNIYKIYSGGVTAVTDFNLDIEDKEFIILVGPSGCGKSTTLRMIAGLEEISKGELYIGDTLSNEIAPKDRDIAMVFQNYALYPHMTVFDNIAYSMKLKKLPKEEIKKRVEEVADILEIKNILKRKPRELSGGQKQRVAMGRAIVRNPKVFLMDEPLSNLDAKLRNQMRGEILRLYNRLQTTFIYVTHDQTEAMTLGTRIVVMKDGIVQQIDTPQRLYDFPANKFVAGFIGSPQMNFIEGECYRKDGRIIFRAEREEAELPYVMGQRLKEKGYINKKIVMGIRPEDISICKKGEDDGESLKIERVVRVYEMLGAETYLYFEYQGHNFSARTSADTTVRQGDKVTFKARLDKMHVFDAEQGTRIF